MSLMKNKRELTDRYVKTVQPEAKRSRVWDEKQKGLALVIEPSGHKSYKVAYRFEGKLEWLSLGDAEKVGLATARNAAAKVLAKVTLGINPQAERRASKARAKAGTTFESVCDRFLTEYAKPRQRAWQQGAALRKRYVFPKLGDRPIGEITRADVRAIINELTVVRETPVLANQVLAAVSAVFSWAVKQDLIPHNPCHGFERNPTKSRERILSEIELPRFWRAFDEIGGAAGAVLKLILLTGQRPGEVRHMRHADLAIGDHTIQDRSGRPYKATGAWWMLPGAPDGNWPGTKNGRTHRVWLGPEAVAIIKARADGSGDLVFRNDLGVPVARDALGKAMIKACEKAGVDEEKRATPHDLRRTHGTTVTSLGYSREQMNRIQNHAEGGIASVYDRHEYAHEACEIQRAVTARILALVEGRAADNVVELRASA